MSIYQEIILDHSRNPKNYGEIKNPTKTFSLNNPLCGDQIKIDVIIQDNKIRNIAFSGQGCVISKASASLLTEYVKGKKISSLIKLDKSIILDMLGIELSPARLKCALLPLEVLRKVIIYDKSKRL